MDSLWQAGVLRDVRRPWAPNQSLYRQLLVGLRGATTAVLATAVVSACSGDKPPLAEVDAGQPYRLFYYADGAGTGGSARLMAVDPRRRGLEVTQLGLDPAVEAIERGAGCSINAWDASWSAQAHRARAVDPRAVVVTGQQGHLYAIPRSLEQKPTPRRIGSERAATSIDDCMVWPDVANYEQSLVIYRKGYRRQFSRLGQPSAEPPRGLPPHWGLPLRHPVTGGLAGYLFLGEGELRWQDLSREPPVTIDSDVRYTDIVGPLGNRYLLFADGRWLALDPMTGAEPALTPVDAGESVGWFAGDLSDIGSAYHGRGTDYLFAGQNIGDSFLLKLDYQDDPEIRLVTRPSDAPFRLLGREQGVVLAFRYNGPMSAADSGEFITIDPDTGAVSVLGRGGRFAAGMAPTYVVTSDKLMFAGADDRPTVARLDGSSSEQLGSPDAHVARQSLNSDYVDLTGGSLSRGDWLVYLDGNHVYSINAGGGAHTGRRIRLGRLPGSPYVRAYKTGSDAAGLLFLEPREGETDLAYIDARRPGSLRMLVRDADTDVRPVSR